MCSRQTYNIQNICFAYGKNTVLDHISILLEPGKFYGIVGPNGSGKSTLLDLLIRDKYQKEGNIKLFNRNLKDYSRKGLSKLVALVPQDFYINFDFKVFEIVLMGRHPYMRRFSGPSPKDIEIVERALFETGIEGFKNTYITQLSGGERQRVVFARALAQDTPILLLDEATSNLDIKHTLDLLNAVAKRVYTENRTVISVMHDLNLAAMYCDSLIYLKEGRLLVSGDTKKVLNDVNIKMAFDVDSKVSEDPYSQTRHIAFRKEP